MGDPLLYDLMHGVGASSKHSSTKASSSQKDPFDIAFDEAIKEQVDNEMANEDHQPANQMLSPALKRAKLEQEIREAANFTGFEKNISIAVKILQDEGNQHLEKVEYDSLQESLNAVNERLIHLDLKNLSDESLQSAFKIPDNCGQYILKVGIDKYIQGLIDESMAIFLLLTIMKADEPDYWFRLGLIAQKCEHYDLALSALSTASELAPEFVGAHIYAAYCHLKKHSKDNALAELSAAKKIQETTQIEDKWRENIVDIENLLALADST
jgi:hypothetical protein